MKRSVKEGRGVVKGAPSGFAISLMVHAAAFLLAGMLVVFTVTQKEEKKFVPPKPVDRPKMKLKKPKVKVKKSAKPKPTTRIVTKVKRASMPDIQLPEMSGMTDGLAGGIGGFDLMPASALPSLLGETMSIGNDFVGTFYDFKRDRSGRSISYSAEAKDQIIKRFFVSGWKPSALARYNRSPNKLHSTTFVIPTCNSSIAPEAFGEADVEGNFWMAHYKGQLVHQEDITFRFRAQADEIIVVRVDGKIVIGVAWPESGCDALLAPLWNSSDSESRKYWLGNNTSEVGDWITLKAGVPLPMELIMADNGGLACFMLGVEVKGVEYEQRTVGGPIFPAFKTEEMSRDLLDAIYDNMVPEELSLTNGPVFKDYGTVGGVKVAKSRKIAEKLEPSTRVESVPSSGLRVWSMMDGKSIEGEYVARIGDKAVLKDARGRQKKYPLVQFSRPDLEYMELSSPPSLSLSASFKNEPRCSLEDGGSTGVPIAYRYVYTANVRQTSSTAYNHELNVEFYAIGEEIHGDKYVLLQRLEQSFIPTKENDRSLRFSGDEIELPNFKFGDWVVDQTQRGLEDDGYLIVVKDKRGEIIEHKATSKWLFEHYEQLKNFPVRRFMDKTVTRVFPTGPPRAFY
ncbi:hypothetical protein [Pontiella sulfatireligans]|uniref:SLA1 homology domain-containing protein n=1 Tax=Pontiella sulfatireligans TaxID=2750658 RepID=A0A6C2UJP8_9BACT|nr:hypothetical protein [Pontiella sulfatireligans]VGO20450.1 hypothetical protein SCARR_02513 [Pontiella sulfatireligans]